MSDRAQPPQDLVRLAADLLEAETADAPFISIDGRTIAPSLVRRAVLSWVDARLAPTTGDARVDVLVEPLRLEASDVTEHVLAWGSVVLSEPQALGLVDDLVAEGALEVASREPRARLLRRASPSRPEPTP
jgi:hypothetical protein